MENEFQEKPEPDVERKAQNNEKTRVENNLEIRIENEVGNKTETVIDLMQKPKVDSDLFFKLIDSSIQGSREYRLISSAFELGVFEALKVPLSAGALADKLGCNPVLMPHFCEALCILGLLYRFEEYPHKVVENTEKQEKTKLGAKTDLKIVSNIQIQKKEVPSIWYQTLVLPIFGKLSIFTAALSC